MAAVPVADADSLRRTVKAFLGDWLVRGDVERTMRYFDASCFGDPLMADHQCLFGTQAGNKTPEAVKRDVRRTLATLVAGLQPSISSAVERQMLQQLAEQAKEQGLQPDPASLSDGFLCVLGDNRLAAVMRNLPDLDPHGKRFLQAMEAGAQVAMVAAPLRATAATMIWRRFGRRWRIWILGVACP